MAGGRPGFVPRQPLGEGPANWDQFTQPRSDAACGPIFFGKGTGYTDTIIFREREMLLKSFGLAAVAAVAIALPAWAHHSHANYEAIKWLDLHGQVTELQWLNPHVWVYLDVKNAKTGEMEQWALEGGSPAALTRGGWKKDTVHVGDMINVKCHLAKDGTNNCLLGFLTTPGGAPKEFD